MRPISEATSRVAGKSFSRKFVALGRVLTHWKDIVGHELACKAQPTQLRYIKQKDGKKPQASLDIATSSADATLLHYQKDLILERINQIFGERWISAIRFVSVPSNEQPHKPVKAKTPLTGEEKNYLSGMLASIPDEDMRLRLEGLGQAILVDSKNS